MTLRIHPNEIVKRSSSPLLACHPSWPRAPLSEVADVHNGFAFKSDQFNSEGRGVPLIRIRDVGRDAVQTWYAGDFDKRYLVHAGDLLVGMDGDFRSARWRGGEALLNQRVCRISVTRHHLMDDRFLAYLLPGYLDAMHAHTSAVTVKHLSSRTLLELPLPLPPLGEQERIVAAIEQQFPRLEDAVTTLSTARRKAEAFIEAGTRVAVQGELITFGELLVEPLANGRSVPTAAGSGFPVLRLTALRNGEIDLAERKTGAWSRADAERFLVRKGDFFISRGNGSLALVGRGGLVETEPDDVAFPDTMIRARVDPGRMDSRFLRIVWNAPTTRKHLENTARTTAGIYKVNQQDLARTRLPVPPLEVQQKIVANMEAQASVVEAVLTAIDHARVRSEHLRRAVLQRAFCGELVAQDRNDEPASTLLERIAAAEQTADTLRRRKRA